MPLTTNVDCSGHHEARQADGIEEEEDDDPQILGEAKTAMKEVVEINANNSDTLTLEDRITMMNDDQRRIFEYHLFHQKQHEDNVCQWCRWYW